MKIAFFISSIGDTDLALGTIKSLEKKGHEALLIPLTKAAQSRAAGFESPALIGKKSLSEILDLSSDKIIEEQCTVEQLDQVAEFIHRSNIHHAYFGVPSMNHEIPFQIAMRLDDIPVLMAYEFMFKPENHCMWNYLPQLKNKSNVAWALPLLNAKIDFDVDDDKLHVIGHLSVDHAYIPRSADLKNSEEIKHSLHISSEQSFAFISSTTQPVEIDVQFLDHILAELPKHPSVQVRLGLHPGIQDLDMYLTRIISIYQTHPSTNQFKIILPESLISRFKSPDSTINNPLLESLFLRININGSEAAFAADRVAQAVPGALLNQAALEGKAAYSHSGKPYLPKEYFSESINTFFTTLPQPRRAKKELGLDEKLTSERCAALF